MTKEQAVKKAQECIRAAGLLDVGPIVAITFMDLRYLDEMAKDCDPGMLETYHNFRKTYRDRWVVSFKRIEPPDQVSSPETYCVSVYETGETALRY